MSSLGLEKLFEKRSEAYADWNRALPGWAAPDTEIAKSFASTADLRDVLAIATDRRERLRAEMIARQEEMDWLIYAAYGLVSANDRVTSDNLTEEDLVLGREERPFVLWTAAEGDFERASALVPRDWSKLRKELWRARLVCIRDNEHIRRLEQPVYKRRWEEQW